MSARNTMGVAFAVVLVVLGAILTWGGVGPLTEERDADGYYMSEPFDVDRPSHAIITQDMDLLRGRFHTVREESFVDIFMGDPDDIRMQGAGSGERALFMGIAMKSSVDDYLDGVAHDEIVDWDADLARMTDIEYTRREGTAAPGAPDDQPFWVTSVSGQTVQTLDWTIQSGAWTAVIMNADASPGVQAEVALGASPPSAWDRLHWITLSVGVLLLAVGAALAVFEFRRREDSISLDAGHPGTTAAPQ